MHTIEITAYKFNELSDSAKEKARSWWREDALDYEWYDFIYDDAAAVAEILGFDICKTCKGTMSGKEVWKPTIFWSGFWSQGDGACFEGSYRYAKDAPKKIKAYAPQDKDLLQLAYELQELQRPWFYKLTGSVKHRGHYTHERSMECSLEHPDYFNGHRSLPEDEFQDICAYFASWIYKQLASEYEWLMSDEQVDEAITCNEYDFDEDGGVI